MALGPFARSGDPKILLLDEPLTNLDAKLRHDMRAELKRLHRQFGMTIVYATPDELEALSMGEEIAVMRDGAVVQVGTPDELYEAPRDLYVAGKIGSPHMNMIKGKVDAMTGLPSNTRNRRHCHSRRAEIGEAGESAVVGDPAERHPVCQPAAKPACKANIAMLEPLGDVTVVSVETGGETLAHGAAGIRRDRACGPTSRPRSFSIQASSTSSVLRAGRQ